MDVQYMSGSVLPVWMIFGDSDIYVTTLLCVLPILSAKTRDGVQEAFEELVQKVLQTPALYTTDSSSSEGFNVALNSGDQQSEEGWCGC